MVKSASSITRLPTRRPPPPAVVSGSASGSSAIPWCRRSSLPVPIRCGLAFREAQICPRGISARIRLRRLLRRGEVTSSQAGMCAVAYKRPGHPSAFKLRPSSPPPPPRNCAATNGVFHPVTGTGKSRWCRRCGPMTLRTCSCKYARRRWRHITGRSHA